jgi:hypothetical protein
MANTSGEEDLQKRLASADVVVKGRVAEIRIPEDAEEPPLVGSANLEKPARFLPASEHETKWREATVRVAEVLKGTERQKNIVVRFPAEEDARWPQAPKFDTGREGIFVLHKTRKAGDTSEERPPATATDEEAETNATAYTALHPADFQPLKRLAEIRKLVKN